MQIEEELTESVTARIPQSIKRQAERDARRERRSLGGHVAWIVEQYYRYERSESRSQGQDEERLTARQRQKARYDDLIRAAREALQSGEEKDERLK